MPVLTDEEVGLAPSKSLSDEDVGLSSRKSFSDADVGIVPPAEPKSGKYLAMQAEMTRLRKADAGSTTTQLLTDAENLVRGFVAAPSEIPKTLLNAPETITASIQGRQPMQIVPAVSPETVKSGVEFMTPGGAAAEGTTGQAVQELTSEFTSAMTSPDMVAAFLLGKKFPEPVVRYFQGQMLTHLPEAIKKIFEAETGKEKTKAALEAVADVAFPASIEKGLRSAQIEQAKIVGPATTIAESKRQGVPVELDVGKKPVVTPAPEPAVPPATVTGEISKPVAVESPTVTEPSLPPDTIRDKVAQPEPELVGLGAATPAEYELGAKTPTGIRNATVDEERIKRGLPPAMQPARRSFGEVWDRTMAKIDQDPSYTDRLLDELRKHPRALTDIEDAAILHRQIELQNEYDKATRDLAQAYDDGRMEDVDAEKIRVVDLSDRLLDLYDVGKAAGTETGRGLAARKMLAYEDFSLAKMEIEKRSAKGGAPLTDTERVEVMAAQKKIEETQKALDERVATADERAAGQQVDTAIKEIKKQKPSEVDVPIADQQKALSVAIGERIKANKLDAVTPLVQKLARLFVEQGVKGRDALIDAVHGVLKEINPEITRRQTMDAISGYGQFKRLSKDEISKELRDLKGQMQQVAKLEDMQASKPPLKTGMERRKPSDEERRLIRLVNEAKNKFQIPSTDKETQLQSSLDTLKTKLRNRISDLTDRLARKDFETKPKRIVQMDEEANKLHFKATQAKIEWQKALLRDQRARRSLPRKIFDRIGETVNLARVLMTSGEFSGVLRQGGFIGIGNPVRLARALPAMFRAFRSEAKQHAVNMEIMSRPNYPLYQRSKLYLSEHGGKLSQMEEAYMSSWAEKIPFVAGTQRAYSTFLNKLRADSFDAMARTLVRRTGELTPERASAIANFINVATGRGNLAAKEGTLVGLNTYFFAPRWVASRLQLAVGQPFWRLDKQAGFVVRGDKHTVRLVAEVYGRFLLGLGVIYGLWKLAGGQVGEDRRSTDFGKLIVGNTRVDLMAGLQQQTVLMSRLASGEQVKRSGAVVPVRGNVPYGSSNAAGLIGNWLRTKLAPIPASAVDLMSGEDVVGQPVTLESELMQLSTPLTYQDIYKAMQDQGVPEGTILALLAIFGAGVNTQK